MARWSGTASTTPSHFRDGFHTWVLDPNAQVQVRNVNERFPFEFNGDGFPLVGQPAANTNGPCPTAPVAVLAVENFYANLVQQLGGQCVSRDHDSVRS